MEKSKRVVVTGMGIVSPLGNDTKSFYRSLIEGRSGITELPENFNAFPTRIGGIAETPVLDNKKSRTWDRFILFAVYAMEEALKQANLKPHGSWTRRAGAYIGTGIGGITTMEENHGKFLESVNKKTSPYFVPMMIGNMASGIISMEAGLQGPCFAPVSACATGNNAIGEAFLAVRSGRVDIMLAGGAEASLTPLTFAGFSSIKAMSTKNEHPEKASAPFDAERDGFVMGEGSGVLVLESLSSALKRNAEILAEIVGYGLTSDSYHFTAPHPEGDGAFRAMKESVDMAGWRAEEIDYINAHGTGTQLGDKAETLAIKKLAGPSASNLTVSSTKSATGHLFGAAGGIESIAVIETLRQGVVPPTLNLQNPDRECNLDFVPLTAREKHVDKALSNGFGFGGHNAVLALSAYKD